MVAKTASQAIFVHYERERETRDYNHPLMALDFTIRWTDNLFTLHLNYRFDSIESNHKSIITTPVTLIYSYCSDRSEASSTQAIQTFQTIEEYELRSTEIRTFKVKDQNKQKRYSYNQKKSNYQNSIEQPIVHWQTHLRCNQKPGCMESNMAKVGAI